jgi:hypothetical protein
LFCFIHTNFTFCTVGGVESEKCEAQRKFFLSPQRGKIMNNEVTRPGRPSFYTYELAVQICETIAASSKGIKKLSLENDNWPTHETLYRWLNEHTEFSDLYARAKQHQVEILIDEILEISDDTSSDISFNHEGQPVINHEHLNRSKLRIDTRKWLAAKLAPRIYGPRTLPTACPSCEMRLEISKLSDDELLAQAKEIFASSEERSRLFGNPAADCLAIEASADTGHVDNEINQASNNGNIGIDL